MGQPATDAPGGGARPLDRQVALVTGGSSGIGRGTSLALARAGACVVVGYRSQRDEAEAVVREIRGLGREAIAVGGDTSAEDDVRALFDAAREAFGTVHVVVPNAGIQRDAPFRDLSVEDFRRVIDVNLVGQFLCAREAVREFERRGMQPEISRALGKIIHMSSVHEVVPWAGHANYAASKGGVALLMRSLAQEVAHRRIRVNSVAPGAIRTPINREAWETEAARRDLCEKIPYGRIGEVEDVGEAVVWLASDASDYVTGTTLLVDGGMALYPSFREGG